MSVSKGLILLCMLLVLAITGCASVPREAPDLSVELGKRISAIEASHIILLHKFFDQKRAEVDRFIDQEWVPVFAEEFFSNPKVSEAWNTIVSENNKQERLKFVVLAGPKLQAKINDKRLELIKPLDDLERDIETKIRDEYARAEAINNSITSFLLSASKVEENRQRYLDMIGITDEKVGAVIDQTDAVVADFLSKAGTVKKGVAVTDDYINKLKALRERLKTGG